MKQGALVALGPAGCGKTAASEYFESTHQVLEMSKLISAKKALDPAFRELADSIIAQGKLIPDEMINPLVTEVLMTVPAFKPIMLVGFGRTRGQVEHLHSELLLHNFEVVFLVFECINDDREYSKLFALCQGRLLNRIEEAKKKGLPPRVDDDLGIHAVRFGEYVAEIDHIVAFIAHHDAAHVDDLRSGMKVPRTFYRETHLYFIDASRSREEIMSQIAIHSGVTDDLSKV